MPRKNLIQSVERALNILETVRDSKTPIRAIDIAKSVGLSSAAANNIVRTLFTREYLDQDENGRYILGRQAHSFGLDSDRWTELRNAAGKPMISLSNSTKSLSFLGVEYNKQIIAVNIVESTGPVIVPRNQDWLNQFHSTAVGKILLAAMTPEKYEKLKENYKLEKFTEKTIADWTELENDISRIHSRGYAVCCDESVFGITSIAVPVYNRKKDTVAALSVVFSSYYLTKEFKDNAISSLKTAAAAINNNL